MHRRVPHVGLSGPFFARLARTARGHRPKTNEARRGHGAITGTVEVRKDETTCLCEALIDGRVVGNRAYATTGGRVSLTHSYVDEDQRHRGIASALARQALEDLSQSQTKV